MSNYDDFDAMSQRPELGKDFDPAKPEEHIPWNLPSESTDGEPIALSGQYSMPQFNEMRALTQSEIFKKETAPSELKKAVHEGVVGDIAKSVGNWIFGQSDEITAYESKERLKEKTPEMEAIGQQLDEMERLMQAGELDPNNEQVVAMQDFLFDAYHAAKEKGPDVTPDVTWLEIAEYLGDNWGEASGRLVKLLVGDAPALAIPFGQVKSARTVYEGMKSIGAGAKTAKALGIAGGIAGATTTAAGIGFGLDALDQLANEGQVDLGQALDSAKDWGIGGAIFSTALSAFKIGSLSKEMALDAKTFFKNAQAANKEAKLGMADDELKTLVDTVLSEKGMKGFKFDPNETIGDAAKRILTQAGIKSDEKINHVIEAAIQKEAVLAHGKQGTGPKIYENNQEFVVDAIKQRTFPEGQTLDQIVRDTLGSTATKKEAAEITNNLRKDAEITKIIDDAERNATLRVLADGAPPELTKMIEVEIANLMRQGGRRLGPEGPLEFGSRPNVMTEAFMTAMKGRAVKGLDDIEDLPYFLREQAGLAPKSAKTTMGTPQMLRAQAGRADPKFLAMLAIAGGGALLGDDAMERIGGAMAALTAAFVAKKGFGAIRDGAAALKKASQTEVKVNDIMNMAEAHMATVNRGAWQSMMNIQAKVPDLARRQAIALAIEGTKKVTEKMARTPGFKLKAGTEITLSTEEKAVVKEIQDAFAELYQIGVKEGVLKDGTAIQNYLTHFWVKGMKSDEEIFALFDKVGKVSTSPKTIHAEARKLPTYTVGVEAGFTPKTMDPSEILKLYTNAIAKAITNKRMITAMKERQVDGVNLVAKTKEAPLGYVSLNHPQLMGYKVHPEIADSMKFFFDATDPNIVMRAALAVNFASKRLLVSASLFHANALLESMLFTGAINPFKPIASRKAYVSALDMLRNGAAGDTVDIALRNGLTIGTIEDIGTDAFYHGMREAQKIADRHGVLGQVVKKGIGGFESINRKIDHVMWDRIATGGKLATFQAKYESALKNPKFANMTPDEIAQSVAEFTNDAFGGQNWRRIAESIENKFGKKIAQAMFAPNGRKAMQLLLFAPDWTISNAKVLFKALPFASKNALEAQLHRAYAVRSAIYFMMIGTAINSAFAGRFKPLWENKDPTTIDMDDGRRMAIFKQTSEVLHWITDPTKTGMNKLGVVPKQALEQMMNKKYLATHAPPLTKESDTFLQKTGKRVHKLASMGIPIGLQSFYDKLADEKGEVSDDDFWRFISGTLGHPIQGTKQR